MEPDGEGTRVHIDSDVTITGKVAQFGRGVIADVSSKLLAQFVANLERDVLSGSDAVPDEPATEPGGARTIDAPEAEPVDLLRTAGAPVMKRLIPALVVLVVVVVVVLILLLR
jgi:uncharacterized protein